MLGVLAHPDKRPVVFLDSLCLDSAQTNAANSPNEYILALYQAFDAYFVLTSNASSGRTRDDVVSQLTQVGLQIVAKNLHPFAWATPYDANSGLVEELCAWFSHLDDRTPTSYLIVAQVARSQAMDHGLIEHAALYDRAFSEFDYARACLILHSQLSCKPFDPDWY